MENESPLSLEEETPEVREKAKSPLQIQKESWYDKVPLTVKQLDWIIWGGLALLVLTFIVIFLDAADIFNPLDIKQKGRTSVRPFLRMMENKKTGKRWFFGCHL